MITWRQLKEQVDNLSEVWLDTPVAVERDIDAGEFVRAISVSFNKDNTALLIEEPYIRTATPSQFPITGKD